MLSVAAGWDKTCTIGKITHSCNSVQITQSPSNSLPKKASSALIITCDGMFERLFQGFKILA